MHKLSKSEKKSEVIKEIKKLGSEIKEIKKVNEDLEDEIEEEEEQRFENFVAGRISRGSSTLTQSEIVDNSPRERRIAKEDESEINFRASYTGGGNPYSANKYTPVGNAEASGNKSEIGTRALGDRNIEQRDSTANQNQDSWRGAGSTESGAQRSYVTQQEQDQNDRKRKNDF